MIELEQFIWVVPLLPLAAFFWIGLGQSFG